MKQSVVVLGAGGFAAEVIEAAELAGMAVDRIYDDDPAALGRVVMGKSCVGTLRAFEETPVAGYVFAIGNNVTRHQLAARMERAGHVPCAVVHPDAAVSRTARIDGGAYVAAGAFVGPQARLGQHSIVNVGSSVGHDAVIGDFAQVCPGARVSGFGILGLGAFMGSNAVLGPQGVMGEWAKLGAASFASRSVESHCLAVGVPAKKISL